MTKMVTRIRKSFKGRLFLKQHRVAKGLSATQMAGRLGIERESVYRQERQPWRVKPPMQEAWADALGIEPAALWRAPKTISLDELVKDQPANVQEMAADIVRRLVGQSA